ncbi:MAG: hypothetical protein PVH29_13945 [Candidatus Zixiibacteriota bacterium]|jgi:hypothetical protein
MRRVLVIGILFLAVSSAYANGTVLRNACREDHTGPVAVPEGEKIGMIAGYECFGLFLDDGGYGTSQATLDEMEDMNEDYQDNEFDPRQTEASAIYAWLKATHEIDNGSNSEYCYYCSDYHTMAEYEALRDAKVDRLNELSDEIDDEWCDLVDEIRAMISDDAYEDYMDSF